MPEAVWNGRVIATARPEEILSVEGNAYFPRAAVHREFLRSSDTHTVCNWKGVASYYDVIVDGRLNHDAAWYYSQPLPQAKIIREHIAFWRGVEIKDWNNMQDSELIPHFQSVRARTEYLCAPLETEDFCTQAMPEVSPPKWHLAHVTWFFEQFVLIPFVPGYKSFHPRFAYLFNSYYETAGRPFPRPQRGLLSRPTVAEIYRYRRHVDEAMLALLNDPPAGEDGSIRQRTRLGLEHEIQHQELLLMDICYNFSINPLQPAYHSISPPDETTSVPEMGWQSYAGGIVDIGNTGNDFAYDNECPRHQTLLQDFRLATRLVSNTEYREFIDDGGYRRPELWLSDAWSTIQQQGWQAPLYWFQDGDTWQHFDLTGAHELRPHEPVSHLSYYEADAYARWAGKRLPTEAEWEWAAGNHPVAGNFLDDGLYLPRPAREPGMTQLFGDLWEWTQSPYLPYPGFRPLAGTLGEYNGKFMSGQMVLRGGCCLTARDHVRASYRNFFHPGDRWVFSGLRLAEDG
jgi:ergothioneine biosynthesis protein EgtB